MLQLPNNCRVGKFSCTPKNWDRPDADPKIIWRISYWFYDDNIGIRKKIGLQSNRFHDLENKRRAFKILIEEEINSLHAGYNPITKTAPPEETANQLSPGTPLNEALDLSFENFGGEASTRRDIKSCLKYFKIAAARCIIDGRPVSEIPVSQIRRNHIYHVMNELGQVKKDKWTNNNFNHYRKYIQALFEEMLNPCMLDYNPMSSIKRRKTERKLPRTMCREDRVKVDRFLKENHYRYWRLMHIFYHSGGRETELFRVRVKDVDFVNQRYRSIIKKGRSSIEKWRPIKDIILSLWKELCDEATNQDQYLFAKGMTPGDTPISSKQISRWWLKHVKRPLKIEANFYWFKHANTTEVMDHLTILSEAAKHAAGMNGHTTEAMVVKIYDINYQEREMEIIKKMKNSFL